MDVGCSGSFDSYSIIENANYSFAELSSENIDDTKEEDFQQFCDKIKEFSTKPLFWYLEPDLNIWEYEEDGGYVKNHLTKIFFRIDMLGGEYVVVYHNAELMKKDMDSYLKLLSNISDLAGSYGLEIVLLSGGDTNEEIIKNYNLIRALEIDYPFLRFGIDLEKSDVASFFDETESMDNIKYFRIKAEDTEISFSEKLSLLVNVLADTDIYLCVWSNLDETLNKIMFKKFI